MSTLVDFKSMSGDCADDRSVPAMYFDGRTAASRAVVLRIAQGRVQIDDPDASRDDPIESVEISPALGTTPRLLRFADGAFCEVMDHPKFAALIAREGLPTARIELAETTRWVVVGVLCGFALLAFAGYRWALPWLSGAAAERIPNVALQQIGIQVLAALDQQVFEPTELSHEARADVALRFARLDLGPRSSGDYVLQFRKGGVIGANALALPSGTIVITDELVTLAGSPQEVLAVLAHEAGHVNNRHGIKRIIQSSALSIVAVWWFGDISTVLAAAPAALLEAKYSRDFERAADDYAADVLARNGLPPPLLADMLERLEAAAARRGGTDIPYLSSHPATSERLARLRQP